MQADEDVGKIALAVPVLVCKFRRVFAFLLMYFYMNCHSVICQGACLQQPPPPTKPFIPKQVGVG